MRPWQHACSSLGSSKPADTSEWMAALEVHEFMDVSKLACADRRHRIVLHHVDLGSAIVQGAFPGTRDVQRIVAQHVREDLGCEATLADWFSRVRTEQLPRPVHRRIGGGPDGVAELVAARISNYPSARAAVKDVTRFLFQPRDYYPSNPDAALTLLMNTAGLAIARRMFGPPRIEWYGDQRLVIDFGLIAEAVIMASYGRIPDLRELVNCVVDEPVRRIADWDAAA